MLRLLLLSLAFIAFALGVVAIVYDELIWALVLWVGGLAVLAARAP